MSNAINVSDSEAEELLKTFVSLRDQCEKSKSKSLQLKYQKQTQLCAEKFDYIVKNKVRKYKSFSNYEDLLQDGRLALVMALSSYKLGRGPVSKTWFWWANHYVGTKISREANCHSTIKIPIKKTKTTLPYKVSQMPVMADSAMSALDSIELSEVSSNISNAISGLPSIQRRVIEMYFELGVSREKYSVPRICKELDLTNKECKKILSDAKKFLKSNLEHMRI